MNNTKMTVIFFTVALLLQNSVAFSQDSMITIILLDVKDECVLIKNTGDSTMNLEGWVLHDHDYGKASVYSYTFEDFELQPDAILQMQSGKKKKGDDEQTKARDNVTHYIRWSERNVWNNSCDIAYLLYEQGNLVAEKHSGTEIDKRKQIPSDFVVT